MRKRKKKILPWLSYRFVFPELPQCRARSKAVRLVSQQVVSMATSSHVVTAAIEGRVVTVGRGQQEMGFSRGEWQTINRAYQEPAAESWGLVSPRQTRCLFSVYVSTEMSIWLCMCVCDWTVVQPEQWTTHYWDELQYAFGSPGFTLHPHDVIVAIVDVEVQISLKK